MTKVVTITLSKDEVAQFSSASTQERQTLIRSWFNSLDESQISELLSDFCTEDRETLDENTNISDISLEDNSSGMIEVDFTGSAYYGCKDANRLYDRCEAISFLLSENEGTITFSSDPPDPIDRVPDEEF